MRGAHTESNWPSSCSLEIVRVVVVVSKSPPSKAHGIISAKVFFSFSSFFPVRGLGQQTSVVVTCLTFLRCSFPKGQYTTGCEALLLLLADYLLCTTMPPKLQVETHKPTFFSLFFQTWFRGKSLFLVCILPKSERFICRAQDRKFWREIEK